MDSLWDALFPVPANRKNAALWLQAVANGTVPVTSKYLSADTLHTWQVPMLNSAHALFHYDSAPKLKDLIWQMKYESRSSIAHTFGTVLAHVLPVPPPGSVLCPVPLHWSRKWSRGFNQAEVLATAMAAHHHIPMRSLLKRVRATGFQSHRGRAERFASVEHIFQWRGTCAPSCVILVDDVLTTGATLNACARVLKENGVQQVHAYVIAFG